MNSDRPINLNKARKIKERAAAVERAAVNRVAHGRTKAEKKGRAVDQDPPGAGFGWDAARVVRQLRKRSLVLAGHSTSVALEPEFWTALESMASVRQVSLASLLADIDSARGDRPLASAARVAALTAVGKET